jgi:glycosyltransferase involved in cell wall biosynthesis
MKVLIIHRFPMGYLTDAVKLCEYLSRRHEVSFLSFESWPGPHRITMPAVPSVRMQTETGLGIPGVSRCTNLKRCIEEISKGYDLTYVYYFRGCSLLPLLLPAPIIVADFRSQAVSQNCLKRILGDMLMKMEARCFGRIVAISEPLRCKLGVSVSKTHILPLGADRVDIPPKCFDRLHLLYVGTLDGRRIDQTLLGLARFHKLHGHNVKVRYTIVGDGRAGDRVLLAKTAEDLGVQGIVDLPGYVTHDKLRPYWLECNVGVSYLPITPYYDHQPPTKTFEYMMAGMPVIGTATSANRQVISDTNGILIPDTPDGFYGGLCDLVLNRSRYKSETIKQSMQEYSWDTIMTGNAVPYIEDLLSARVIRSAHTGGAML